MALSSLLFLTLAITDGINIHAQTQRPQPTGAGDGEQVMLSPSALRRAAQTQQTQTGPAQSQQSQAGATDDDVIMLSPFVVNTDRDQGFVAAASLSGGRLGGELKDTPVAYSVLTSEFIEALGLTDLADMAQWMPNSGESRNAGDMEWSNNDFYLTSRGASSSGPQRDFFYYSFNFDSYNIERLDVGRGPNSILFGNSSYASTPNALSKRARTDRRLTSVAFTYGSWDNKRATLDHNQPLNRNLALRLNALYVDKEGWMRHDFERKKAITLAGTWRVAKNTEIRLEAERGNKQMAALGNHYDDQFSAWNGIATYSGTTGTANSTVGTSRYGANIIVFTPSSGNNFLAGYQGWAYTRGGNYATTWTNAGGYTVNTTDGVANISGNPISNQINLPSDLYAIAEANSFFRVPDRDEVAYVDTNLYEETYYNYTLTVTQQVGRNFFAEAAVNFAGVNKDGDRGVSNLGSMYIDVNSKLPDGTNNPNFLQPYGQTIPIPHTRHTDNINARLSLAYVLDNTRIGSFRFNVMGGYARTETERFSYTYALKDNDDPRLWPSEKPVYFRYYHFTDNSRPYDLSDRKWLLLDAGSTTPRVVEGAYLRRINDSATNNGISLTEYGYGQAAVDAKFFKKRLNLLAALRTDSYRVHQRVSLAQADYPENWDGITLCLKPNAPADYDTLSYRPIDDQGNLGPEMPAEVRPRTTTNGMQVADSRYANTRFQDDYNTPEIKDTVTTYSLGAVFHVTQSLSIFANYAESFVPLSSNYSIEGTMLGARSGEGRDFGIRLTTPGNKLVANLIRYTGYDKNALSASVANARTYINTIVTANPMGDDSVNGINKRNMAIPPSGINDTVTKELSGWELEITANLTRNWRLMLNGSITDAYQTDTYHHMRKYLDKNLETLRLVVQDAGGVFVGDKAFDGPDLYSSDGRNAVTAWNNLMAWRASWTDERQKLDRLVEKTANVFTDYTFRTGPLRGLRIGAGLNYRGKEVIGYRGGGTIEDPNNPGQTIDDPLSGPLDVVYQPAYTIATATINYNWRINRKITLNINLRVTNLFDYDKPVYFGSISRPVNGDLSSPARVMTPVNFRFINPRQFIVTTTVKF